MPTVWETAKAKLYIEITEGRLSDDVKAIDVWNSDEVYKKVKKENFSSNLRELRKRIHKFQHEAEIDKHAFANDRRLHPIDHTGRWGGSKAAELLKKDIDEGKSPSDAFDLYYSPERNEYKIVTYEQFRKHMHQEIRSRRDTCYWLRLQEEKREEKAEKEARKENKRLQAEKNAAIPLAERELDEMTKNEMKALCKELGLKVSGNKNDLAERIRIAREQQTENEPQNST